MEEEVKPIRQQQRRLNPTILDVVKKEVTKLLAAGIIYLISDSQWVSPVQVVPKKSGMIVMKNQQDELVPTRIQNNWRVCIDYRRLNQATCKDHFPLPFIDQVLEKLSGKSHYCFLDGFSGYMQIHIAPKDQHKTTFTFLFGTFSYTRMPFGLCNAPSTFQRCMTSIFSNLLQDCIEVFMDDFMVYADSFETCLSNLSKVLKRCINTNLVLNFEKCHFMVTEGIMLGHLVSNRGIELDKSKINIITSLPNPASMWGSSLISRTCKRFIKNFSKLALPLSKLLQKDVEFKFNRLLDEASERTIRWYPTWNAHGQVIISCGSYPNVPLLGTQGAINYNPQLTLRQAGYPIMQPPSDEALTPFVIHGSEALEISNLRKIKQAWGRVVRKGAELGSRSCGASRSERIQAIGLTGGLPYSQPNQEIELPETIEIEEFEQILNQMETEQRTLKRKLEQTQDEVLQERQLKEESMKKARREHQHRLRMTSCLQAADQEMGLRRTERDQVALQNESLKETITTLKVNGMEKDKQLRSLQRKIHQIENEQSKAQTDLERQTAEDPSKISKELAQLQELCKEFCSAIGTP
ncbi:Retrovirus-related Pol polyprotein from transposon 17.6, partial [Mucuna pruriens]